MAERPEWLIRLLNGLDGDGRLAQLPARTIIDIIARVAVYRDRWNVTGPDPLGPEPAPPQPPVPRPGRGRRRARPVAAPRHPDAGPGQKPRPVAARSGAGWDSDGDSMTAPKGGATPGELTGGLVASGWAGGGGGVQVRRGARKTSRRALTVRVVAGRSSRRSP